MKTPGFEVFQSPQNKQWYWRLRARNGRIIAQGESHTRKQDADRAVKTVTKIASDMWRQAQIELARSM